MAKPRRRHDWSGTGQTVRDTFRFAAHRRLLPYEA
jgi:hypothetical protein